VIACKAAGDDDALRVFKSTGRMIARKTSGVWSCLGDRNLFPDALGNPFAPFAFGSHMVCDAVGFREAQKLGLIQPGEKQTPKPLEFQTAAKAPQSIKTASLREALEELMDDSGVLNKTPMENRTRLRAEASARQAGSQPRMARMNTDSGRGRILRMMRVLGSHPFPSAKSVVKNQEEARCV
jgi:hypothetical protein